MLTQTPNGMNTAMALQNYTENSERSPSDRKL